ncbi:hypothetical protein KR054_002104 [Drosophila jambulina]|nr:hypothetical protein KR054_002104 [Drosophila jambulina]
MPRNATCRTSGGCVANGNGNQDEEAEANNNNSGAAGAGGAEGIVKQELEAAPPVCHRKSERRRVARDIFLVFEEQSTRRRGKGARGKNTRAKQKFGHLKVANTPRISKSVLREIKTEPKCSAGPDLPLPEPLAAAAALPAAPTTAPAPNPAPVNSVPRTAAVKLETKTATTTVTASSVVATRRVSPKPKPKAPRAVEEEEVQPAATARRQLTTPTPAPTSTPTLTPSNSNPKPTPSSNAPAVATPSVNPIFLWVKQDDTRIVEVRCEDYDKRNRIRLTKTTNGWRSMPRTDASSTRIVKFFHGSAAPLMKVKREQHQHQRHEDDEQEEEAAQHMQLAAQHEHEHEHEVEQEREREQQPQLPVIAQNLLQDWEDSVTQLPDEIEEDEEPEEEEANAEELQLDADHDHADQQPNGHLIENVVVLPSGQQSCPSRTPCFDGLLDSEETNASTKATKTNTPTYQSSTPSPLELQLCPKTGLFLPKGDIALIQVPDDDAMPAEHGEEEEEEDKPLATAVHDPAESLDANTKNLKDLLDDADDLLQNCSSDHGSSGADLLDSLVKRSCEDNLVQETTTTGSNGNNPQNSTSSTGDELSSFCVPDLGKDLPSILNMDNDDDAPKCLSFNEAGEIEGLNGELFLGIEAFEKQQEAVATEPEPQPPTPATVELTQTPTHTTPTPEKEKEKDKASGGDETPKDLSYKKREEVCPPSESRSQCAVTSSSDILKSPERDLQLPANSIPAEVETTSETIKNLILEQFLKLNNSNNNPQQAEPMDLGKAGRDSKLETVVIDDEEEEDESSQPLKKRPKASIKMDKDPDALTQLKMLISNPQWKVPDPILVPKDRLGAVLASPAREIPLLLTTRPELRLPEAFAYPEIIQNPNILVVTMEQLEAILKTEAEQAAKATKEPDPVMVVPCSKARSPSPKQSQPKPVPAQPKPAAVAPVAPTPPSPAADSSLSTDLNATTLALLQQMLWLPYFGQLSQEFFKTIKDPLGLQRKFMSNLLPLYNSQFGLQHLDELYKQCMKQKPAEEQQPKVPTPAPPLPTPPAAATASAASGSTNAFNGFTNPVELAIMQKLLQPQLPQFLNWEASKEASSSSSAASSHHHQEHKRPRREPETETTCNLTKSKLASGAPSVAAASAAAAAPAAVPAPAPAAPPAPAPAEHKPRLTIKSLSNLLEPEANVVPLLNVPFDGMRGRSSMHKTVPDQGKETATGGRTLRSSKACVTYNPLEQAKQLQQHSSVGSQQQRKRGNMLAQDHQQQQQQQHLAEAAAAGAAGMDANSALWHPLFGSNPKQGYNSPWQWTTVTATGE